MSGYIHNEPEDLNKITSSLRRMSLDAHVGGEHGDVNLEFNYDDATDSVILTRINGYGWGEDYYSEDGSGQLPDFLDFNYEKFADLDIINFASAKLDQNADVFISTYLSDGDGPTPPGDASIFLNYNLYQELDYQIDGPNYGVSPLNQLAVLGDSVDSNSRFILDINAESLVDDYNIESADIEIKFDPALFGTINASDIKIGGSLPLANAVHIDNDTGTIRFAAAS